MPTRSDVTISDADRDPAPANGGIWAALTAPLDDDARRRYSIGAVPADKPPPPRPGAPMGPSDWIAIARDTASETSKDRVTSIAGGVTFFALLALFPAITALVSLYGMLADPATIAGHLDMLRALLPEDALDIIRAQVMAIATAPNSVLSAAGLLALMMAIYSATGGMKAVMGALNVAFFKVEKRGFLKLNLIAIGFTLGAILLVIAMLFAIAVIPTVLAWLPVPGETEAMVSLLRWPAMIAVLLLALSALYRWGPDGADTRWRWVSPGAILATLGLVGASMLFSWYAANFADYNKTYGSLGAVIGLMMWLWIASIVVLVGAELNSAIERHMRQRDGAPAVAADPARDEEASA